MKCRWKRRCAASQVLIAGVLWVGVVVKMRCRFNSWRLRVDGLENRKGSRAIMSRAEQRAYFVAAAPKALGAGWCLFVA